ncbi:hypothetical protein BGZ68_009715 [Mortierella alpina]|nr:hypothetical protein BGZ68_009715 [Mortierella alpina]
MSSSVGIARRLIRDQNLLPSSVVKDACDSPLIHVTFNGCYRSVFTRAQFDNLTQGFDQVLKENIRRLVEDYFRLLEASFHQDRRLEYSGSIISWRCQKDNEANLVAECLKRGNVYFLLYEIADLTCNKPQDSIAIKIGNTQEWIQRADSHRFHCKVPSEPHVEFPEEGDIPFAYLLEEIVHEMLRAHQHDIACQCKSTHTELYWFHLARGYERFQHKIFDAIVKTLGPIIHRWIAAIRNLQHLHIELQHAHLSTLALQEVMARW